MKILIFPSTTFEAISYATQLKNEGHYIVGASSVSGELISDSIFDQNIYIPHIIKDDYIDILTSELKRYGITHFWTSVSSVYGLSKSVLVDLEVEFLCCDPLQSPLVPVELVSKEVDFRKQYLNILQDTLHNNLMGVPLLKSTLFNALSVPGQSHFDKLITVCQIFSDIPVDGDLVEIGVQWGRSAVLFSILTRLFEKGNLLCIDPWPHNGISQGTGTRLENYTKDLDSSSCFTIFATKLAALFPRKLNYIREYSDDALLIYKRIQHSLTTPEFGQVLYTQKISLLHIDGNHSFEAVKSDVEKWCPLVIPGGWIIFDDYNWSYGKGPSTVVDDYLRKNLNMLEIAFFCGGAMFVKRKFN